MLISQWEGELMSSLKKVVIGCIILLLNGASWVVFKKNQDSRTFTQVAINWQAFPSVSDSVPSSFLPTSPLVILVYGLTDCNLYVEQIERWSELAQIRQEIDMVGVISHPYEVTARRYLLQAPRPYPGRVDSTSWFVNRFRLGNTPALLLVSSKGDVRVIYPRNEAQADSEKNRLLDALL